nr:uncharacterized protein LOC109157428 [Ipomoea trifida]
MSGQPMVEAMSSWPEVQDHRRFRSPPALHILRGWVTTPGGRAAMGPLVEVWLQETKEGQARIHTRIEAAGASTLQQPSQPEAPVIVSPPASGFLITLERARSGVTSSVMVASISEPSEQGTGGARSMDPSSTVILLSILGCQDQLRNLLLPFLE